MSLGQGLDLTRLRWPSWRRLLVVAKAAVLGAALPAWLGVHLAVPTAEAPLRASAGSEHWTEISLGPAPFADVPVAPRKINAMTLAPKRVTHLRRVYASHRYDLDAIAEGHRGVPPIFVRALPPDWNSLEQVAARKRIFVKTVLPLILKANAEIRGRRQRLRELVARADGDLSRLSLQSRSWLTKLAERYKLEEVDFDALLRRVDEVPVSLALAQAAIESGWGRSRFALEGNALFGQWTWDTSKGLKPADPQEDKQPYAVRSFAHLGGSVAGYMRNLNTHPAYKPFRQRRAALRKAGKPLDGLALAGTLTRYSQRGEAYVAEVRGTIRANDFHLFDRAAFAMPTIG